MMFEERNGWSTGVGSDAGVALLDAPESEKPVWTATEFVAYDDDMDEDESYFLEADDDEDEGFEDDEGEEFEEEYEDDFEGGDDGDDDDDL